MNIILIFLFSLFILYIYIKETKKLKNNHNSYYEICININDKNYILNGFLDTGNKLSYCNTPIILVNKNKIDYKNKKYILVPYSSISDLGMLKCIKINSIIINKKKINKKIYIGLVNNIGIDGVDVILNERIV